MNLFNYIEQGGTIMYLLLIMNILGISLLLWRLFVIFEAKKNAKLITDAIVANFKEVMGDSDNQQMQVTILKDEVQAHVHSLEFGLNTIKIIASIAPLMGLLGTVIGILSAFQVIADKGLSDPSLFAGGIAMALITTVGGLIVAIPHFVGYNYLTGVLDDLEINLEKMVTAKLFGSN